jgi:hypothetical protein
LKIKQKQINILKKFFQKLYNLKFCFKNRLRKYTNKKNKTKSVLTLCDDDEDDNEDEDGCAKVGK